MSTAQVPNTTEGIVIRVYPFRDADLILRVITAQHGKLSLIAKYARKSRKRFSSSFDIFDRGVFEFKHSHSGLAPLLSYNPSRALTALREDLDKYTVALAVCECFDRLVPENYPHSQEIFEIFDLGLRAISESGKTKELLRTCFLTIASLMRLSGFMDGRSELAPSAKHLLALLEQIEAWSEKALVTKDCLFELIERRAGERG